MVRGQELLDANCRVEALVSHQARVGWKGVIEVPGSAGTSAPTHFQGVTGSVEAPAALAGNFGCPHGALGDVPDSLESELCSGSAMKT